jgi:hypothetical protein
MTAVERDWLILPAEPTAQYDALRAEWGALLEMHAEWIALLEMTEEALHRDQAALPDGKPGLEHLVVWWQLRQLRLGGNAEVLFQAIRGHGQRRALELYAAGRADMAAVILAAENEHQRELARRPRKLKVEERAARKRRQRERERERH